MCCLYSKGGGGVGWSSLTSCRRFFESRDFRIVTSANKTIPLSIAMVPSVAAIAIPAVAPVDSSDLFDVVIGIAVGKGMDVEDWVIEELIVGWLDVLDVCEVEVEDVVLETPTMAAITIALGPSQHVVLLPQHLDECVS